MYKPTETMCNGFLMIGNKKAPTFSGRCFCVTLCAVVMPRL